MAQTVKHLSAMQETRVRSLGWEDPLEKEMAAHSSILAWRIPGTGEPGGLLSMGSHTVRHNFVGKVMALLFNMLSRLVITFLPRSKHLLISWLQSPSAVIFSSVQLLSRVQLCATP